jgi:hypothetical protein
MKHLIRTVFSIGLVALIVYGIDELRILRANPPQPTPIEALKYFPGQLLNPEWYDTDSVEVLKEQEVAGGIALLYRWQSVDSQRGDYCLATTFVTPKLWWRGRGWEAQSSGRIGDRCDIPLQDEFAATFTVGGNDTGLATAFGYSERGSHVHVAWSDGQIDVVPIEGSSFLLARPQTLQVTRIDLLDEQGRVLESRQWPSS